MKSFLFFLLCITSITAFSQEQQVKDRKNSFGVGMGFIPKHHEEVFIPAVDFEYSYKITDVWSAGLGTGIHFTQTPFYSLAAGLNANIFRNLSMGISAGGTLLSGKWSRMLGAELSLEFSPGRFSYGPVVEISHHNKHEHFMIGMHCSYSF